MRRSTALFLAGIELAVLSWWFANLRFETGLDALQYHRMANSIVRDGLAPWVVNPLSYVGVYPGSDSSGVPFLVAIVSLTTGMSVQVGILVYDALLLMAFGLGLFSLVHQVSRRIDLALIAVLMGSLAYGLFTSASWSLDERSFNVAFTPLFLFLVWPNETTVVPWKSKPRMVALGLLGFALLVSHLSFLLLIPFLVLIPPLYQVVRSAHRMRRTRPASIIYFGVIALSPLALMAVLSQLGILSDLGLQYQLESSALFTGSSSFVFLLNAMVFVGTRIGAVNLACAALGFVYLASRPYLSSGRIALGGFVFAGFLGLPIVLYSKDLLMPIFVLVGSLGLGCLIRPNSGRRGFAIAVSVALVISGSVAFDAWNISRTTIATEAQLWAEPGVTPAAQSADSWMADHSLGTGCVYGNNGVAVQQVVLQPSQPLCTGIPVDRLIDLGIPTKQLGSPFNVVFLGIADPNPSNWFTSPELTKMAQDFARLPSLDYQSARALLMQYDVRLIVVDLQRPYEVPLYSYQGTRSSIFFQDLWNHLYPYYLTPEYAIFEVE